MKMTVDCITCGREIEIDATTLIDGILQCAKNEITFTGVQCGECLDGCACCKSRGECKCEE